MIILDLDSLRAPQWSRLNSYYGKPWIWCLLHNFGGNRRIYGDLQGIIDVPFTARNTTMIGTIQNVHEIETQCCFRNWIDTRSY
jgi:alpha-N-acetylglucosaminidase